jgi:hypothetical protein
MKPNQRINTVRGCALDSQIAARFARVLCASSGARMHQSELVSQLLKPMSELDTSRASPKEVILAALAWPTEGWTAKALEWVDAGVPLDNELVTALEQFASVTHNSQSLRHKSFALAKRWRRANQGT